MTDFGGFQVLSTLKARGCRFLSKFSNVLSLNFAGQLASVFHRSRWPLVTSTSFTSASAFRSSKAALMLQAGHSSGMCRGSPSM